MEMLEEKPKEDLPLEEALPMVVAPVEVLEEYHDSQTRNIRKQFLQLGREGRDI